MSSALALCAFMGYSAYCPTKYALRGLSDCLRTELKPYNVRVAIAYPPGMRTPGGMCTRLPICCPQVVVRQGSRLKTKRSRKKLKTLSGASQSMSQGTWLLQLVRLCSLSCTSHHAATAVDSYAKGEYHIASGDFGVNLLSRLSGGAYVSVTKRLDLASQTLTAGMQPRTNTVADFFLLPLLAIVGKVQG